MRFGLNKVEYNCSHCFLLIEFDRPRFAAIILKKSLLVCVFASCQIAIRGHSIAACSDRCTCIGCMCSKRHKDTGLASENLSSPKFLAGAGGFGCPRLLRGLLGMCIAFPEIDGLKSLCDAI
jgi:hypothetical protein